MKHIFVNLKRFDVPKGQGGICPVSNPVAWIESVVEQTVELGLGQDERVQLVYLLPESLIPAAINKRACFPENASKMLGLGSQGVHWEDIAPGKNFGAFTSSVPAKAVRNLGATWAIIGHSEERKAKTQVMLTFEPTIGQNDALRARALAGVDQLVQQEVQCALGAGLNVLLCVGETAEQRGGGEFEEQKSRIEQVLRMQVLSGLAGVQPFVPERQIVIGYEPVWAIGPGKVPPGQEYIQFVSGFIKQVVRQALGFEIVVVYGGGLKEENAAMIAGIDSIGGGLVALTRFTGEIGFDVKGLKGIVDKYLQ